MASALLAACGGGTPEEALPSVSTRCDQPFTWLDLVRKSGNLIGTGAQGEWMLTCPIRQLQSASLTVCITHADTRELQISLTRPDGLRKILPTLSNWNNTGACLPDAGQPWTLSIALDNLALKDYNGRWTVRVEDLYPNNTSDGIFHGWLFALQGLR